MQNTQNVNTQQNMATVFALGKGINVPFDGTEGDLFWKVGGLLKYVPGPNVMRIQINNDYADLTIDEDDSVHVACNGLKLKKSRYDPKYLTMVDPETNGYSYFKLNPNNMGPRTLSCGVSFGRIGADKKDLDAETILREPYPSCMYWLKYYEKINHGYQDMSDVMLEEDAELEAMYEKDETEESATLATTLYNKLRGFAKEALEAQVEGINFLSEKPPFTKRQVDSGWKILNDLGKSKNLDDFNKKLLKLMTISPRKIDRYRGQSINDYLAKPGKDLEEQKKIFAAIIEREESLLQAMDAVLAMNNPRYSKDPVLSPFGNIEISEPDDKEIKMVMDHLSDQLKPKVKKVYRVVPNEQQAKFDTYVADHQIDNIKLLWHGSRNENWISIIKKSLMLNPNAVITGKMWGCGIYFAPSSMKSWGYTSGGFWTGSSSNTTRYMGLYATAYGNPYFPTQLMDGTKEFLDKEHANCLHAKASVCGLQNDEIIFFDEAAICLQYLVEFED